MKKFYFIAILILLISPNLYSNGLSELFGIKVGEEAKNLLEIEKLSEIPTIDFPYLFKIDNINELEKLDRKGQFPFLYFAKERKNIFSHIYVSLSPLSKRVTTIFGIGKLSDFNQCKTKAEEITYIIHDDNKDYFSYSEPSCLDGYCNIYFMSYDNFYNQFNNKYSGVNYYFSAFSKNKESILEGEIQEKYETYFQIINNHNFFLNFIDRHKVVTIICNEGKQQIEIELKTINYLREVEEELLSEMIEFALKEFRNNHIKIKSSDL